MFVNRRGSEIHLPPSLGTKVIMWPWIGEKELSSFWPWRTQCPGSPWEWPAVPLTPVYTQKVQGQPCINSRTSQTGFRREHLRCACVVSLRFCCFCELGSMHCSLVYKVLLHKLLHSLLARPCRGNQRRRREPHSKTQRGVQRYTVSSWVFTNGWCLEMGGGHVIKITERVQGKCSRGSQASVFGTGRQCRAQGLSQNT